jgi:diacylglycerol kinase family enzyme
MRILLIHNPEAGGDSPEIAPIRTSIERRGHTVRMQSVQEDGWREMLRPDDDLVAVAGGDGTVGMVLKEVVGRTTQVTLFPEGSANNIARSLGFADADPEELIDAWSRAKTAPFDVGVLDEGLFVESVGGGIFATMIDCAEEIKRQPGGPEKVQFGLKLLRGIVSHAPVVHWGIRTETHDLSGDVLAVEVMNIRELGPNVPLAPGAETGDGLLELTLVRDDHREALVRYLDERRAGIEPEAPVFETHRVSQVALDVPEGQLVHRDDEPIDEHVRSVTIRVDGQVSVLVPLV